MSEDDLVEKLRDHADRMSRRGDHRGAYYYEAAADEIERLNGIVRELRATIAKATGGE